MKTLLLCLLALLTAVLVASVAGSDTGYVVFTLAGWTVKTSATFFVIVFFLSLILFYVVVRSIVRFFQMPEDVRVWRKHRHQRRAEKYLTEGLLHMTEGRWHLAEKDFRRSAPYSRAPYVNYLCAARAAQESGNIESRDDYLRLAYQNNPDASLAVGITQAELQLSQKQTEQALATLKDLQLKQPGQSQVKQLLLHTYTDMHDWQSVLDLIPAVEKAGLYSHEQIQAKQLEAFAGLLKEAGQSDDLQRLNKTWENIPKKLKQHFYLIEVYVTERLRFDDTADCEALLRTAIKRQWDEVLVRLYGLVSAHDLSKQLAVAESYLQTHARDAVLLLTLGRICKRNQLWGKAKDYLQESLDAQPNPEAYYEFAQLHEHEGQAEQAALCYEKGLKLSINSV